MIIDMLTAIRRCPHGKAQDDQCNRCDADDVEAEFLKNARALTKAFDAEDSPRAFASGVLIREAVNRIEWRDRHILQLEANVTTIRAMLRGLPCTRTAKDIDNICADALGEPRTP